MSLILKWNSRINITGLKDPEDILVELIEDSLAPLNKGLVQSPVLDAGCGAGFPTIPIAMKAPDIQITAVDSNRKKINFLRMAIREINLVNVHPIRERLEHLHELKGKFRTVLSKAFMPPERAVFFLKPFVAPYGKLIVYSSCKEQLPENVPFEKVDVIDYELSDGRKRVLVVFSNPV